MRRSYTPALLAVVTVALAAAFLLRVPRTTAGFSGPATQNGYRLVGVYDAPRPSGYHPSPLASLPIVGRLFARTLPPLFPGLLIDSVSWPASWSSTSPGTGTPVLSGEFTSEAVSSTGARYGLACRHAAGADGRPLLAVAFPAALPGDSRWLDVTVRDKKGRNATWRVTRLRRARQQLPPPVTVVDRAIVDDVHVRGRAWYDPQKDRVMVEMRTNETAPGDRYRVEMERITREWKPERTGSTGSTSEKGWNDTVVRATLDDDPAPHGDRFVRIHGSLVRQEKHEEKVWFRNLPLNRKGKTWKLARPVSTTTPSGVRVTLAPHRGTGYHTLCWSYTATPSGKAVLLPKSPLYRRHRLPINVRAGFAYSYTGSISIISSGTSGAQGDEEWIGLQGSVKLPLTIGYNVYQVVDIRRTPITLTVPVQPAPPADANNW